jgi:hypothetical protein
MSGIPVKEIGELLDEVSSKVPKMLNGIMNEVYSEDAGTRIGKGAGSLYKELIASGLPADAALEMTREYMNTLTEATRSFSGDSNKAKQGSAQVFTFTNKDRQNN